MFGVDLYVDLWLIVSQAFPILACCYPELADRRDLQINPCGDRYTYLIKYALDTCLTVCNRLTSGEMEPLMAYYAIVAQGDKGFAKEEIDRNYSLPPFQPIWIKASPYRTR